jgi:hypothetical protein
MYGESGVVIVPFAFQSNKCLVDKLLDSFCQLVRLKGIANAGVRLAIFAITISNQTVTDSQNVLLVKTL